MKSVKKITTLRYPYKTSGTWRGFSLFELAVVLVVMGLIAAVAARVIPALNMQNRAIEIGSELRNYAESVLGRAEAERYFLAPGPDNFTPFPHYINYANSVGIPWGYLPTRDLISSGGLCNIDPAQKIAIVYCKSTLDNCTKASEVASFVEDVALVLFSSDKAFKERVKFYVKDVPLNANYSMNVDRAVSAAGAFTLTYQNFTQDYNAIIMKIAAAGSGDPMDETVLDYTYQEIWDKVGCPAVNSVTQGDVLSVRVANYAVVDMIYDFVPIPLNFLDTPGAEYCFESYEGFTTDFGLAKTYERDVWDGAESNYNSSDTGYGAGGGVATSGIAFNASDSNYCNRANNRIPTVTSCNGSRMEVNWMQAGITFPKWYKDDHQPVYWYNSDGSRIDDRSKLPTGGATSTEQKNTAYPYGVMKWFFCGGNGAWDRIDIGGTQALTDYQVRLRPGYRGTDKSNWYRINNRAFKAYAR
ncbi:MAG: type II secretion system GspH family protein, partial [Deferribacteraceae bacterium]|nr:type II secretion system GspH family protein [Deferribacteraceae bacterium]